MGYLAMFVVMYIMYYNLVYSGAFTLDYFIRFLRFFIYAYTFCLIGQQLCMLIGFHNFPVLNLQNQHFLSLDKLPSLSWEPSSSARILAVLFFAYLKCNEYKYGVALSASQLFVGSHKWVTYVFFWSMLTMGSGTAFVALGILLLYFVKKQYLMFIIPLLLALYFIIPTINYEPLNRARGTVEAVMQRENDDVIKSDGSAAHRIVPMLNTVNNIDLTSKATWFGSGIDSAVKKDALYSSDRMIGLINDYGLVSWILSLVFVFTCCIRRVFSIETVIFVILLGGGVNNIAYIWGALMIFTIIKYFNKIHFCKNDKRK
jgi:hypothetical protein